MQVFWTAHEERLADSQQARQQQQQQRARNNQRVNKKQHMARVSTAAAATAPAAPAAAAADEDDEAGEGEESGEDGEDGEDSECWDVSGDEQDQAGRKRCRSGSRSGKKAALPDIAKDIIIEYAEAAMPRHPAGNMILISDVYWPRGKAALRKALLAAIQCEPGCASVEQKTVNAKLQE
jgi:hypothetical protein